MTPRQTIHKLREYVSVYKMYRAFHNPIYAALRAKEIVFHGLPF